VSLQIPFAAVMNEEADHPNPPPAQTEPTYRLVIRARIIPEGTPSVVAPKRSNRKLLVLALGAVALVALIWVGISVLRTPGPTPVVGLDPPSEPATPSAESTPVQTPSVEPAPPPTQASEPQVREEPDASSPIEVIPDVPRSASDTIRGTIIVSVRVTVDEHGKVIEATAQDAGPSRYFERLAVDASRKWTFAPSKTRQRRTTLVWFYFTRAGTKARAEFLR
jgi:TonB family protein